MVKIHLTVNVNIVEMIQPESVIIIDSVRVYVYRSAVYPLSAHQVSYERGITINRLLTHPILIFRY